MFMVFRGWLDEKKEWDVTGSDEISMDALQGAWVTEKVIRPRAITPKTFMERVDGIDEGTSVAVYKALKGADILNATDFLKEDPRCLQPACYSFHHGM